MFEDCPHCGTTLDPFGQCYACDTYGTPAEQRRETAEAELKRCTTCQAAHTEATERCEYCEGHNITAEDYENWCVACDDARTDNLLF